MYIDDIDKRLKVNYSVNVIYNKRGAITPIYEVVNGNLSTYLLICLLLNYLCLYLNKKIIM